MSDRIYYALRDFLTIWLFPICTIWGAIALGMDSPHWANVVMEILVAIGVAFGVSTKVASISYDKKMKEGEVNGGE